MARRPAHDVGFAERLRQAREAFRERVENALGRVAVPPREASPTSWGINWGSSRLVPIDASSARARTGHPQPSLEQRQAHAMRAERADQIHHNERVMRLYPDSEQPLAEMMSFAGAIQIDLETMRRAQGALAHNFIHQAFHPPIPEPVARPEPETRQRIVYPWAARLPEVLEGGYEFELLTSREQMKASGAALGNCFAREGLHLHEYWVLVLKGELILADLRKSCGNWAGSLDYVVPLHRLEVAGFKHGAPGPELFTAVLQLAGAIFSARHEHEGSLFEVISSPAAPERKP